MIIITVEGGTAFPIDMLRYDRCYPQRPEDVLNISVFTEDHRVINLVSANPQPTIERWRSFGWTVAAIRRI